MPDPPAEQAGAAPRQQIEHRMDEHPVAAAMCRREVAFARPIWRGPISDSLSRFDATPPHDKVQKGPFIAGMKMDEGTATSGLYPQRRSGSIVVPNASQLPRGLGGSSSTYRLKAKYPSAGMLPADGASYECPWIEDSITIHADGNVSCGLDDPHATRSFGNVYEQSITEIFANPEFELMNVNLRSGR